MVASWEDLALVQQYFLSPTLTHPTNVSQKAEYNDYISHIQMYIFNVGSAEQGATKPLSQEVHNTKLKLR